MSSNVSSSIRITGPVRSFIILGVLFCCLVVFLAFVLLPQNRTLNNLRVQLKDTQEKLDDIKGQFLNIPAIQKRIRELKSEYSLLKKKVPDNENIPEIVKQLSEEIGKLDMKLISFIPEMQETSDEEDLNETTIEILMQTNYRTLGQYFEAVESLPLVFKIKDVAMEKEDEGNLLSVRLVLATYNLSPE